MSSSTLPVPEGSPGSSRWIAAAARYAAYALLMAAVLGGILGSTSSHGLYDVVREAGPVEIGQLIVLAAASAVFWLAGRFASPTSHRLAALCLVLALVRELDSFFNQVVARDSWKLPVAGVALWGVILLVRGRRDLPRELPAIGRSAAFGLLFAGFLVVMVVSRLLGWQEPWESSLGESYVRWVPRAAEELTELAGYMLVLYAAIEACIASRSSASSTGCGP